MDLVKLCVLKEKTSKKGNRYFNGKWGGQWISAFPQEKDGVQTLDIFLSDFEKPKDGEEARMFEELLAR